MSGPGPGGVQPFSMAAPRGGGLAETLRPGQVLQGRVLAAQEGLALSVGGRQVPLPRNAPLVAGQTVTVHVHETAEGPQLLVSASANTPVASETHAAPSLPNALAAVLESFGATGLGNDAAQLVPANLPLDDAPLRSLLSLFAFRAAMGNDLETIASLVSQAAQSGAIPADLAEAFAAVFGRSVVSDSSSVQAVLQYLAGASGTNLEAQLALAAASGRLDEMLGRIRATLRAQVARLRGNEALAAYLRGMGQLDRFEGAVSRVLEHLSGAEFQMLRSLEQPYVFLTVPFDPAAPVRHAYIHFFGDGKNQQQPFDGKNATIVLDVSTERLGDLWVSLKIVRGRCSCWLRATRPEVVEAIRADSAELVEALERAGYPNAQVKAIQWDGDRLKATASLMRRFSPFTVEA